MKSLVLFDVDGTLTKSRCSIEQSMIDILLQLKQNNDIELAIVGGSNYEKIVEQLGKDTLQLFTWVFSENGLVTMKHGKQIACESMIQKLNNAPFTELMNICLLSLSKIDYPYKFGSFIEHRNGMINISPIGRACPQEHRDIFYNQDKLHKYREQLIKYVKTKWEDYMYRNDLSDLELSFSIGGQISVDIFPKGWDKTYCLSFITDDYDKIYFFGDKTYEGGNDYEIFKHTRTKSYHVNNYQDTIIFLQNLFIT